MIDDANSFEARTGWMTVAKNMKSNTTNVQPINQAVNVRVQNRFQSLNKG